MLVGLEPFDHPDLPRIVASAMAGGCERFGIHTNAAALRSDSNSGGVLSAGLRHLRVTLLGGTPGLHDALAGAPGALDATVAGLQTFRHRASAMQVAVHMQAVVPVCRHNVHDVPATVGLAVSQGFDGVTLVVDDPGLGIGTAAPWIRAACDTGIVNGVWVEVDGMPFCAMPGYGLHVSDLMRPRSGCKGPQCDRCAVDSLCGGAAAGTAPDQLSELDGSVVDARFAAGIARARGGGEGA